MKTISVSVSEDVYEQFREASERQARPIAQLIREAMAVYQAERLKPRAKLDDFPVFAGHRPLADLPSRSDLYDEVFARGDGDEPAR